MVTADHQSTLLNHPAEQRAELARDGLNQKQIIMNNQELLKIREAAEAGTI